MRDTFNQVLTGVLEWAYHESDGSYKMAAYATAGLASMGAGMADDAADTRFFGMPATIWVALITAAAGLIAGFWGISAANRTASDVNQVNRQVQSNQEQVRQLSATSAAALAGSAGPLERGQKLCRVLQGRMWRDGLIVPQNWTVSLCVDYMKKTGGTAYQLGCIYTDGTNLGKEDGSFPSPNCGWQ
jgi:hypothetical protein